METKTLKEFFAVTETSVYHVKIEKNFPVLLKIEKKKKSEIDVGKKIDNGTMVSIGKQLIMFVPEGGGSTSFERRIEYVNTRYWGGNTSPIVALFLKKEEAIKCFNTKGINMCDIRWSAQTKEVLSKISDDHPFFSVCHYPEMALFEKKI